ncbi:MAG: cellulase family glycosylhydrolase [Clostridium sp.]|nr:cellulase family glycosylhydrolase [Clostridium sp.]
MNKKLIGKIFIVAIIIIIGVTSILYKYQIKIDMANIINRVDGKTLNKGFKTKIKSGDLSVDYSIDKTISDVDKMGLNTVNVPIEVDISDLSAKSISVNEASLQKAKKLIHILNEKDINVILEPYPWINKGQDYETNLKPENVNKFFITWKEDVLKKIIQRVAVPERADAICIGSNFVNLEKYSSNWDDIIAYVRQNYKGLITYKTNWWYTASFDKSTQKNLDEKINNNIFSKVDYISIAAYFELSNKPVNTYKELKDDLYYTTAEGRGENVVNEITKLHNKWNKPIFFGELGFPRRNGAAQEPWNPIPSSIENGAEQARCFEAYRTDFNQQWFLGFSVFAVGNNSKDKNYYPSKESVKVIENWFK